MSGTIPDLPAPDWETLRHRVAGAFDAGFYLDINPDVRAAGVDPVQHYILAGAAEGRNPNRWFDTSAYGLANPDVAAAGFNPLWHYLAQGRAQGRAPRLLHAPERMALGQAASLAGHHPPAQPVACLLPDSLRDALGPRLTGAEGVTLSVSHDRYTHAVGGVQILVSDEQLAFNARGEAYLHIAPRTPRLTLAPAGEALSYLHLTLDGAYVGTTTYADLAAALAALRPRLPLRRHLVLHCLLGHQPAQVAALHAALQPRQAVFWVNDYEAICPGYTLLRNGVRFCGAPPPDSPACRVCVHGPDRIGHLRQMLALFESVPLHVVAPSEAALAVWQAGARLPHLSARVHEYAEVLPDPGEGGSVRPGPVRVAYIGLPLAQKGWHLFADLAARLQGSAEYSLFHLTAAAPPPALPGVEVIPARVTPGAREAMTDLLRAHGIQLVLALSPWPETFCLAAYEALAAGADLVVLRDGGNLPDLVLQTGRGVVADDAEAVLDFFLHGGAARYAALAAAGPRHQGQLASRGMTATLCGGRDLEAPDGPLTNGPSTLQG